MAINLNANEVYYYWRAIAYGKLGKLDLAVDDFTTVIERGEKFPQIYIQRSWFYFLLSDLERSKFDAKKSIEINPDDLDAYVLLAEINRLKGQMELSLENLNYVIVKNPNYFSKDIRIQKGEIYFWRGILYNNYFNEFEKAMTDLKTAAVMGFELAKTILKNVYDIEILEIFPQFYLHSGYLYPISSDYERIIFELKGYIEINPDDLDAYVLLAVTGMFGEQFELSLENTNFVIANNPNYFNESIGMKKGRIYSLRARIYTFLNEYEKAIANFKTAADMGFERASEILKDEFGIDYP